jgi:hypothetical protein
MTSAEVVVEFVKGRPELEKTLRKKMVDVFCAPEAYVPRCADIVKDALTDVSEEERKILDKMRGKGRVDWAEVARAFGAREDCTMVEVFETAKEPAKELTKKPIDWEKARALGAALAKDSSALSGLLIEFEKRVVELNIGVEASVPIDAEMQLLFGKESGKWGLFVVTSKGQHALQNASRAMRIGAAHQMVALLARLMEEGEQMLQEVRGAGERVIDAIEIADEVKSGR